LRVTSRCLSISVSLDSLRHTRSIRQTWAENLKWRCWKNRGLPALVCDGQDCLRLLLLVCKFSVDWTCSARVACRACIPYPSIAIAAVTRIAVVSIHLHLA
jgi:hypothetical protein